VNIFDASETIPLIKKPVLTIGTFDGVHIGHQKIISRINKSAKEIGGESVLFTFYPHPRTVIFPDDDNLRLLQTQEEKLAKLKRFGLDNVVIYPFTKEFSRLSATHFVRDCLVNQIGAVKIVIGYNHQFGKNREGSLEQLRELAPIYGFEVEEIPAQEIDEVNVSSTKIRNALLSGEIATANKFLQEPFQLNGVVEHGKALGRTIGFPTANISIDNKLKIIPKTGVYFVRCSVDNIAYFGIMNIGFRPTVGDQNAEKPSIEVNIFDFKGDIYGKSMCVELLEYLREEQKFDSLESLKNQIRQDEIKARTISIHYTLELYSL